VIPARAYLAAGALALAFGAGWVSNGWRLGEQAAELQLAAEHERAEAFRWVQSEQKRSAAAMAVADTHALAEVRREQEEADRLRACIDRGDGCGLRVRIVRTPAKCENVPEAGAAAGVGDRGGEWAELDPAARTDYFALRGRLVAVEQALRLCVSQWPGGVPAPE